ncbi:GGDEF domain-containing protein [Rhodanobacter sp. DHB23]|uniref:GGDEF domain-containing protein n=1 Tax=Rhodanobacter sp. DHB23 TaxID=2775923 RepID=UPI001784426E|nr:GGDEF domain-containing protein [Rhodanobacter sp. DHB23]MBD8873484.1 diguanylate cyclase [Rhodanobacter sp. DHB23]
MAADHSESAPYDALVLLEREQERWRDLDALLRRLLSRLTYAAEGRNAGLDTVLGDLRLATRNTLDEERLAPLLDALTDAVASLDESHARPPRETFLPPPPPQPAEPVVLDRLLLAILDRLPLGEAAGAELESLRRRIVGCHDAGKLQAHGEALAALVARHIEQLEEAQRTASRLLDHVDSELTALTEHLDEDNQSRNDAVVARRELGERMAGEMLALRERARAAADLPSLQADVHARLAAVGAHLATLREREQAREQAWYEHTARMRERIRELESSTRNMEATLKQKLQLADTDPLTGLANRRALEARMASLHESNATDISLLVLDIDHFKSINDLLGHAAGDRALRIVAEQLQAALRPGDYLARYGGEEFVALLAADAYEAMQVADRLRIRIGQARFHSQNQVVPITLSCGIATMRDDDTPESLFERADQALYRAKDNGRNRCEAA